MIKGRPVAWLIFGWIGGLIIGLSFGRLVFDRWLWEVSTIAFVSNIVLTLVILTALWWRIWRPHES